MFRRKATTETDGAKCPFCEFVNANEATTCVQCYYELQKAPRDQGDEVSKEVSDSIFDELMSDEDDSYEESDALDVVLAMDTDPLEINQYEVTDFESEEPEKVGFIESSSPELNETVSHEEEDISADEVGEPIKDYDKIDFSGIDPLADVPEPVHKGRGAVFSPNTPEMDGDLKGHIGGSELPALPDEEIYENKIDLTSVKKAPAPTPATLELPEIPDLDFDISPQPVVQQEIIETPQEVVEVEDSGTSEGEYEQLENQQEIVNQEETISVSDESEMVEQNVAPVPQNSGRFWPWPESEPWDPRQVHREVVTALELTKSGKNSEAMKVMDDLGPHLSEENIDLIYHIGMVLKQVERVEDAKSMLELATISHPDNEHVNSAIAHLGIV